MQYAEIRPGLEAIINESDDEVHIALIFVEKEKRCQGIGSAYIKEMIDYATRNKKIITLIPSDVYGGKLRRLKKFYKRLGFKQIGKKWQYIG